MMSAGLPLALVPWDKVGLEGSDVGQGALCWQAWW